MYQWKKKTKLMLPLTVLSVCISQAIYSGAANAGDKSFIFGPEPTQNTQQKFQLSEVLQDGSLNASVSVDNPENYDGPGVTGFEIYLGQAQAGENHDIADYAVNITGNNTTGNNPFFHIFGLHASGKDANINIGNFTLDNDFVISDGRDYNNTALFAGDGSKINVTGNVHIRSNLNFENDDRELESIVANNGIYASGSDAVINVNGGDVYINNHTNNTLELLATNGNDYIDGESRSDAVSGKGGGVVNINLDGTHKVNIFGNLDVGDKDSYLSRPAGQVNIVFNGADSYWHGHEANVQRDDGTRAGILNVTFKNGAYWIPDGKDAEISAITLENGGTVNLHGFNMHRQESVNETVKIHDLKGNNGNFLINVNTSKTDENRRNGSDFIEVVNSSTGGTHTIEALDIEKLTGLKEDIWIADAASNINFKVYDKIDIGNDYVYDYIPLLRSDIRNGDPASNYGVNWYLTGVQAKASRASETAIANTALNYAMATSRIEIDSLNKRLGELRNDQQDNGLWVRYKGGELESDKGSYFKNKFHFYQLGYDNKEEGENSIWTRGIAAHYMKGSSDFEYGAGDNKSFGGSIYSAWNRPAKQDYLDLVLKYSHHDSDFNFKNAYGYSGKGDSSNWSISASAEYGREFTIGKSSFIEPQGQLVYTHVDNTNYKVSKNLQVKQDDINSLIGRAGLRIGHRFEDRRNSDIYLKVDALHEFAGDRGITIRGTDTTLKVKEDGKDTWINYGVGANFQLTQDNNSRFYVDLEKSASGDIKTNWQANVGFRMEW